MKYLLLILFLLFIYTAISYGRIAYIRSHSKNPAIKQTDLQLGSGDALRYIAAGDSTAVGEGASNVSQTYPVKIATALSANRKVQYKNVAVSGAKTSDLINNQLQQIIDYNPDIVTISISANDATHLISKQVIVSNYKIILDRLLKETHSQIYITNVPNFTGATILPLPYIWLLEYRSKYINPEILKFEGGRVHIVNIHDYGWDKFINRAVTYSFDHFHPSDTGYQNWTEAFLNHIK